MKSIASLILLIGTSLSAHADFMAPATLDLVCKDSNGKRVVKIVSNANGSAVTVKGKTYPDKQLIAGTEGGPAYLQAVNNEGGYNITIAEGDLVKAFDDRIEITSGHAKAFVQFFNTRESYEATCTGLFSFRE